MKLLFLFLSLSCFAELSDDALVVGDIFITRTAAIGGALTLNGGTVNSYILPTTRGSSGQVLAGDGTGAVSWTNPTAGVTIGDIKQGIQAADHAGWIKLDGRAKSTLTATQQAEATSLGIGANLPNAAGSVLIQNGTALGSVSGSMSKTIAQTNLPNVTLTSSTTGSHSHTITASAANAGDHNHPAYGYIGGAETNYEGFTGNWNLYLSGMGNTGSSYQAIKYLARNAGDHTHTITASSAATGDHAHTTSLGGSGTALDVTPKSLSVNAFLYLGP